MSDKVLSAVENVKQELNQFKTKIELRGANKWGSLPQRMRWVVVTLSQAAIFLGTGLLEAFSYILLKSYVVRVSTRRLFRISAHVVVFFRFIRFCSMESF